MPSLPESARQPSPTAVTIRDTVFRTLAHTNWKLALPALILTCGSLIVQAAEVARIAAAASKYPAIARISSDKSSEVEVNGRRRELRNTNHLVGAKGWDIRLSKTGYTEEAGRCLAMRMKSGGQTITVILLDADGSAQRLRDAAAIRKSLAKIAAA